MLERYSIRGPHNPDGSRGHGKYFTTDIEFTGLAYPGRRGRKRKVQITGNSNPDGKPYSSKTQWEDYRIDNEHIETKDGRLASVGDNGKDGAVIHIGADASHDSETHVIKPGTTVFGNDFGLYGVGRIKHTITRHDR